MNEILKTSYLRLLLGNINIDVQHIDNLKDLYLIIDNKLVSCLLQKDYIFNYKEIDLLKYGKILEESYNIENDVVIYRFRIYLSLVLANYDFLYSSITGVTTMYIDEAIENAENLLKKEKTTQNYLLYFKILNFANNYDITRRVNNKNEIFDAINFLDKELFNEIILNIYFEYTTAYQLLEDETYYETLNRNEEQRRTIGLIDENTFLVDDFKKLVDLLNNKTYNFSDTLFYLKALVLLKNNNLTLDQEIKIISNLSSAIWINPINTNALLERASFYAKFGNIESADLDYTIATKNSSNPHHLYQYAKFCASINNTKRALELINDSLQLTTKYIGYRGRLNEDLGNYQEAINDYTIAVVNESDHINYEYLNFRNQLITTLKKNNITDIKIPHIESEFFNE